MRRVSSWGRLSAEPHDVVEPRDRESLVRDLTTNNAPGIAYGMGRSYGDACLNPDGLLFDMHGLDRFLAFDPETGRLFCEAGVVLRDIQRLMLPRGWSLPVVPGTQLVTVGGAIANDVHGKNHHATGTFADHVVSLRLLRRDGEVIDCGPATRPDWFAATAGGIGLTGLIVQAELQLKRSKGPWLEAEIVPYAGLDAFFELSDTSLAQWEHAVSWIDCTVPDLRGLFLRAREAQDQSRASPRNRRLAVPVTPPFPLINRLSLKPLNAAYYALNSRHRGVRVLHQEQFLFPLDAILDWNRMYGPRGFYQYQSVVPRQNARAATGDMLQAIARSGEGSVLAVLKTFGDRMPPGLLSFVQPGVTLALDFGNRPATAALFERLDAIVRAAGGRLYLAKDARMPREMFEAANPRLQEFLRYRDPGMSSAMSRRLMGR
jgi:FAD/FMN-containing dehydrogenase